MINLIKIPIGKVPRLSIVLSLVILLNNLFFSPAPVSANSTITILDTLGAATPTTKFSVFGTGSQVIFSYQLAGPEFVLTQPTVITEIGAFINNCKSIINGVPDCPNTQPVTVQIRPANNGNPDFTTILATFILSDDQDPLHYSYESVKPNFQLDAGTYFAIFATQGDDVAGLLGNATVPFEYVAGSTTIGFVFPFYDRVGAAQLDAAVRILGTPAPLTVGIDIRPLSWQNIINPKSHGLVTVAILSNADFNAPKEVSRDSLTFGRTGEEKSLAFCLRQPRDVNRDGLPDLVCLFYIQRAGFKAGDQTGILKGRTLSGLSFTGMDSIRTVP
jgi:hypothetical protein